MNQVVRNKIAAVRARHALVALGTGAALAAGSFVTLAGLSALADWWFDFPWLLRAVLLALYVSAAGYLLARYAVWPVVFGPDDEDVALMVERAHPHFGTRLIAAVQFARPQAVPAGASAALVAAMVRQTEELADKVDFTSVIKLDYLLRVAVLAAATMIVWLALLIYAGQGGRDLLSRVFLSTTPVPTKTQVQDVSGSFAVARGDDATLAARSAGWRPSSGMAEIYTESKKRQTVTLNAGEEDATLFTGKIEAVQESFQYRVRLFDGKSEWHQVTVVPRPAVTALTCTQVFPAYTGLADQERATGELALVVGSKLRLRITANKEVRTTPTAEGVTNRVLIHTGEEGGVPRWAPLTVVSPDRRQLEGTLEMPANATGFAIHLVDDYGIASKDPAVYRVDMVPDRAPMVRIVSPDRKEVLATSGSRLDVGFVAEDDFAVGNVALKYRVNDGAVQTVALETPRGRSVRGYYPWEISSVAVPAGMTSLEGARIDYWLEVADTNTVSGPGVYACEAQSVRVVTRAEKQAELMARLGESLGNLRDVSEDQEKASEELGTLIREQTQKAPR